MNLAELARLRRDYEAAGIDVSTLPDTPLTLWRDWLSDAEQAGIAEINAMVVSTVDADGTPSSRTVLCKGADPDGFVFFTNYDSRKGRAISAESRVSLLFPWHPLARQIIVAGTAGRVGRQESEAYFATRPRGAQLSAWASAQSSRVADRAALETAWHEVERRFPASEPVPCPPHWGGFRVVPQSVEFWQGRQDRLHDRIVYRRTQDRAGQAWSVERLSP